jgi:glycosyltransferase involved in cell wall biosynthesis
MTKPVTVLVVSSHGDIVGGGEISLLALLMNLDRSQWTPIVVVPTDGVVASRCKQLGIVTHVIPLPALRRPGLAMAGSVGALRTFARQTGAALLHANGSRAMFYAGLAGWLASLPVIWHVRVADRDTFLDRFLAILARLIVVNSKAVGSRFDWGLSSKVRCVYNGVDLSRFSPRQSPPGLRRSLGLPEKGSVVMSVGRFVRYKGYEYLLEAALLVRQAMPDVHWVLVGDGELNRELENQVQFLGLEAQVHFTGWRDDIPELLALCDLFVLPSLREHFGRVLIEAMGMAKAVVATDSGGVPEIVIDGETGILVPPAQPKPLADAVLTLMESQVRAEQFGRAGRRRVETLFKLERHAADIEALYREVLGVSGGRV